ncbi:hypothetical protein Aph02nite_73770 [Actinoplanes philippinensis]|uniref:Uncharacterized protein n=1 Tax=Actinoplanes philippinensis TaxID=35752 RepID=A0A1I2K5H5_9ACTN|nr:hypothetical protein [Actinoplanes philippinensis]GIE81427.1 hypothetical protein Aph02nite_73770 [Actinoplanes philippinensis]SFF61420.1 hypothetical protein SAMN05421541_11535 [Actinoplanes philippinensis]
MRRLLPTILAVAGAILVPATPASAHAGDATSVSDYRVAVTGLSSPLDGLTVRVVEGGARLELSNDSDRTVEILGYSGEPYLEVRPDGTYENVNSPATYLNQTLGGETPVPATAAPTAAPTWRRVSGDTTVRWHDQRARWTEPAPPPAVTTDPGSAHRVRDWAIPLRDQARTFEIQGTIDYEPPPAAWAWWLGSALLGLTVTLLARRWPRSAGPLAFLGGSITLGYALTTTLDGAGWAPVPILAGLLACAALRWQPPFYLTLSGFILAAFAGFGSADVFFAAVVPSAGPAWFPRVAVACAIGAGAGLALTGVLRLRAAVPEPVA